MSKQRPDPEKLANELAGASAFFRSAPTSDPPVKSAASSASATPTRQNKEASSGETVTSKEVKKFTSKLLKSTDDPAVNKVGFYFTHREIDALDALVTRLAPQLRDEYNIRATKNELIRAFMAAGMQDIEEHGLESITLKIITNK